jgi:ribonucleoside-diphosphate reductase beta chain
MAFPELNTFVVSAAAAAVAAAPASSLSGPGPSTRALLDPGLDLTLRPMRYPQFYERYRAAIRNTWTVEEVDLSDDLADLKRRLLPAEQRLVKRLVAFFATGDSIVANNLVLNLYKHINAPEARLYLSRQLFEEALHVQFYLTLLDTYLADEQERAEAFAAVEHIPSIRAKAQFCFRWIDSLSAIDRVVSKEDRRAFLLNLVCFAACIEGLFFFAAFAYVYFLRSKGLLNGLAAGTNWVFRDESAHMTFAFDVIHTIRVEEPELFDSRFVEQVTAMLAEAVDVETAFAEDMLAEGVPGLSVADTRRYLEYVADQRLAGLGLPRRFGATNPFGFMELQDVSELANFFERTASAYQIGIDGTVAFNEEF